MEFSLNFRLFQARKRKRSEYEDIDFSEDTNSCRKSTRRIKNNGNSENGRLVSSAPHPTPAASPTPDDLANPINEWSWEKVLCSDPELLIRQASRQSESEEDSPLALQHRALDEKRQAESLKNPTDAMKVILQRIEEREREREQMSWQQQLKHFSRSNSENVTLNNPNPLTPAMEEVIAMRQKRISVEIDIPITPEPSDSESESMSSDSDFQEFPIKYSPIKKKREVKKRLLKSHAKVEKKVTLKHDPFEFTDEDDEADGIGQFRSCLNVVYTSENSMITTATTTTTSALATATSTASSSLETEVIPPPSKRRRISIQNDVSPIRNKESPPEPIKAAAAKPTKSAAKSKTKKKKSGGKPSKNAPKAKRLSSIPEEVFIESIQNVSDVPQKKGRKGRQTRAAKQTKQQPVNKPAAQRGSRRKNLETNAVETPLQARRKNVETATTETAVQQPRRRNLEVATAENTVPPPPKKNQNSARKNMRSSDSTMRTTRAQDWKWENVLLTNPERILRRK